MDNNTIASGHGNCQTLFKQLSNLFENSDMPQSLQDDHGRFRIWAENSGAYRTGEMSLSHRLRETTDLKKMVEELLGDLSHCLHEGDTTNVITI
jgi:hypothetical protein